MKGFNSLKQLTKLSKLEVPQYILDALKPIKDDDAAVRSYGVKFAFEMCQNLLQSGVVSVAIVRWPFGEKSTWLHCVIHWFLSVYFVANQNFINGFDKYVMNIVDYSLCSD